MLGCVGHLTSPEKKWASIAVKFKNIMSADEILND